MKGVRNTTITDAINRSEAIRQKITNLDNQRKNHRLSANLLVHRQVWASEWERLQKYADCCDREIRQYLKSALVEHELSREDAVQYRKLESHIEEMRQCLRPVDPLRSKQAAMLIDAQIDTLQQELAPISSSVQQLEREDEENFSPLSTWILVAVQIEDTKSSKPKVSRVPTLIQNVECIDTTTKFALYEQIIGLVDQRKLVLDGLRKRGSETGERDASHRIAKLMDEYRHFSDSSHLTSRKLLCERMLLEFPGKSESLLVVMASVTSGF
ncbi:hypothetical protein BJ742DRAFT_197530 [Cladochytrium replicatum]|nr:hypothetical protein BJ742DRAFT_197530 [Cladochytrium replicatum]